MGNYEESTSSISEGFIDEEDRNATSELPLTGTDAIELLMAGCRSRLSKQRECSKASETPCHPIR